MGSASELDYHLLLCRDFEFVSTEFYERQSKDLIRVRKMLSALLTSVENQMQAKALAAHGTQICPHKQFRGSFNLNYREKSNVA
jgi:hypothetical protein